jgi:hypothetical protein
MSRFIPHSSLTTSISPLAYTLISISSIKGLHLDKLFFVDEILDLEERLVGVHGWIKANC